MPLRRKKIIAFCSLIVIISVPTVLGLLLHRRIFPDPPPLGSRMSPLDFRYADGNEFSIQTLSGRKVAWIFFTTDCQHCQRQLRNFDTLAKRFDARELQIIALSLDDASSTKSFLEQYPLSIPIVVSNDKNLKQEFRVAIVPAVYLYDRHGRLVQHRLGEYSLVEDAKLLKDFIGGSFTSIGQEN